MCHRILVLLVSIAALTATLGLLGSIAPSDAPTSRAAPSDSWIATAFPVPRAAGSARP